MDGVNKTLAGTRDWFGAEERLRQQVIQIVRGIYESYGFEPLSTPAIEFQSVLYREESETAQRIFEVSIRTRGYIDYTVSSSRKPLGLRYDHTVPLARVVAQHAAELALPYKRYAIGPVWRPEKPQKDRSREFWQVDFDTVGAPSLTADAETVAVLCSVADAVGLEDYSAIFNNRVLLDGMATVIGAQTSTQVTEMLRSWDKIGKTEFKKVPERLASAGLKPATVRRFTEATEELRRLKGTNSEKVTFLRSRYQNRQVQEGLDEIEQLLGLVETYGNVASHLVFQPHLARGFAYYTGPVFEMVSSRSRSSFGGGGRFDHLIQALGGPDLPATGASFGLERFVSLIQSEGRLTESSTNTQVFVTMFDQSQEFAKACTSIAHEVRSLGFKTELYVGGESLGRQLALADRKGIPAVVIIGPSELSGGLVTIKDMRVQFVVKDPKSNQRTVARVEMGEVLREILG